MVQNKNHTGIKEKIHPRSKHRGRYNLTQLVTSCPELKPFVITNKFNDASVDFSNPEAVKMLNKALLNYFYGIKNWEIPQNYLCPPVPGRADYIHHIADLLSTSNNGEIPSGNQIKCLDIGVGANCIYPIIGFKEYGWSFVGSDIDPVAVQSANQIIDSNPGLKENIEIRIQANLNDIFRGIIRSEERFEISICNPPFHASPEEANAGTMRKLRNLKGDKNPGLKLNFGGQNSELWCSGGEKQFVQNMILQSREIASSILWFTTLISKETNLKKVYFELKKVKALEVRTIPMGQGNKTSRIVAWTFFDAEKREKWLKKGNH